MTIDVKKYNEFLKNLSKLLDIPPGKYKQAVERYESVGKFLQAGDYPDCNGDLSIYVQGSFLLGTVTRPIKNGIDSDYDIDLVNEFPISKNETKAKHIKHLTGNRLKESDRYRTMMDKEGKRCWTLNYAEEDGIGFHMDILPCVHEDHVSIFENLNVGISTEIANSAISITDKKNDGYYSWSSGNPKGYGEWFHGKNRNVYLLVERKQREAIIRNNMDIYASIDEVPMQLVKTPLQQVVQIMKRHRDYRFNEHSQNDFRPISMIITTLAAHLYQNESDVFSALKNIIERLHYHSGLLQNQFLSNEIIGNRQVIYRKDNNTWYIGNPVNPAENFADRWHENNHARAKAFFTWVEWIKQDLVDIVSIHDEEQAREVLYGSFGAQIVDNASDGIFSSQHKAPEMIKPRRITIEDPPKPWKQDQ